ncbi:MAG: hypothetical protein JRN45_08945 [Nitrososphaerota archaeon]|nr:hypothetical protein [Nitrososphaerota archaeon]
MTDPTSGIKLTLAVNSSTDSYGEGVKVMIDLINTKNQFVNLSSANDWPLQNLTLSNGCDSFGLPYGIAVERGYYSSTNLSLGTILTVFPASPIGLNSTVSCPFHVPYVSIFVFHPLSDAADRYYYLTTTRMNFTLALTGYWSGTTGFHVFEPGWYTLACGDEWGQLVVLHVYFRNT